MLSHKIARMNGILFLTGASGSGKTALVKYLFKSLPQEYVTCFHFDDIGIPSEEEMINQYGSPKEWQKHKTFEWIEKLIFEKEKKRLVIFEGQTDLDYIESGFKLFNFENYQIVLVHCDNQIRHNRLQMGRGQIELVNEQMDNWSSHLKRKALEKKIPVLDTTRLTFEKMVEWLSSEVNINLLFDKKNILN